MVKAQPSGPKSESKFTVGIRTWNGEVLSGAKLGNPVMFKAVMIRKQTSLICTMLDSP